MKIGLLWLEGPLQSWGHDSRYGRRATLDFPTRSGILGMIAAAMGKTGEQQEWLDKMRPYKQTIAAYGRLMHPDKPDDTRVFQPPLLKDFHMVGSGYDLDDPWQTLFVPKKSDGTKPVGSGARMTTRHYLQDMAFACALEMPEGEEIEEALKYPVWALCLGRKSCIPSDLVWRGNFDSEQAALDAAALIASQKGRQESFRVYDGYRDGGDAFTVSDVPISFGLYKRYADRIVSKVMSTGSN